MTLPRALAPFLALALAWASPPAAATQWQGGSGTNWSTGANWVGGVAPPKNNSGTAEFTNPATANTTSNVDQAWAINGLDFYNNTWTLTGQPITFIPLGGAGIRLLTNHTQSISNSLVFNRAVPVEVVSAAALTLPDVSGTGSLSKVGPGALTINSLTLAGAVTVSAGSLTASPTSGTNAVTVNSTLNTTDATWGALSGGGTVNLNGFVTFNQAGASTFTGSVSGAGSMQKSGAGTLTLAGNNSWSGTTTIAFGAGTLKFGNGAAGTFPPTPLINNLGTLEINLPFAATANIPTMSGPGSLVVTSGTAQQVGGSWDHFGPTTVNGGTLVTTNLNTTGSVTVNNPGTWTLGNATIGSLAGNGNTTLQGNLVMGSNNADTTYSGFMTQGPAPSTITKVGTGTFTLAGPILAGSVFNIDQGTVRLQNGAPIASNIVVKSGATLSGQGGVGGNIQVNPGGTIEPQQISANFVYGGGGTVRFAIGGTTPASQYGRIQATNFEADGMILQLTGAYVPVLGDTFTIVDNTGANPVVDVFAGRPEGSIITFNGMPLRITYVGGTGNDIVLSVATQTVTPSKTGNGTIAPDTAQTVINGQTRAFALAPAANNHVASVGGTCPAGSLAGGTYTTGAITANCTVVANFTVDTYTVTPSAGSNGTISPTGGQVVAHGGTQVFTITPSTGYTASVGGTCPAGSLVGTTYTTGIITANCTVAATFTLNQYTVTPSAGANGTISPTGAQTVGHGATQVFTVTPATGYTASVGGTCPAGSLVGTTYTTGTITANCTVAASFTLNQYTVTPSAGANGTISPSTLQPVNHGATTVFTVTPSSGYTAVVGGSCGGALVGNTFTTSAITANCTVSATFTLITYTVTPSAGANGAISPAIAQAVGHGGTTVFTVTPNAGYTASVGGTCGGSLAGNTYTTSAIVADCTVTASFTVNTYSVTPSAGPNGSIAPAVAQAVNHGATTSFTVTPASGYTAVVGGTCGGNLAGNTYTTNAITANCTVAATFTVNATPGLSLAPGSLAFGGQSMGTTAPVRSVTVTNTGTATLTITGVTANNTQFDHEHNCAVLAPAATCTIAVEFTPVAGAGALNAAIPVTGSLSIASNASGSPHSLALTGTAEKSLVTHYYRSILRRAPDAGGASFWANEAARVAGLNVSVNEVWFAMAQSFYFSAEYAALNRTNTGFITDLYTTFFNRVPDSGGLAFWVGNLDQGMPREVALASFMFSTEFGNFTSAIFGNTSARAEVNTVVDFYRGLLARLPDDGGFAFWLAKFRTAQCTQPAAAAAAAITAQVEAISQAYTDSAEYAGRGRTHAQYVGDLYNSFLRRGGDLAGVQYWIGRVQGATLTRDALRVEFRNSAEFQARVAAIIAQGCQ